MVRSVFVIAGKDLRQQLRNSTLLLFAIVLPLGIAALFSTVLDDPGGGFQARYLVVDEDHGPAADAFVDDVLGAVAEESTFAVDRAASVAEATRLVDTGAADAVFVLPAGFSAAVDAGRTATLRVVGGADAPLAAYVADQIARSYATDVGGVQLAVALTDAGGVPVDDPDALAARVRQLPAPLTLAADVTETDRVLASRTFYPAGMAVFFLFFVAMLSVNSILAERGTGTLARLLASPVPRPAILVGKLLGGVGTGVAAMTVLVVASTLLLGADWGPPAGVAALVVALVLAATGLMALVATVARSSEQATTWMSGLAVLLGMFGGTFAPLSQLGGLWVLSYLTPHRWFLQGLSDLAGGDVQAVLLPVAVLTGLAVTTTAVALLRIGKLMTV
ncbi:ABC transporter permease [Solwaraspora sp. WMMB335]|uniref:ABC transporter permease n=1 Tax=Solwaraspora sp. WMMB335 TaxID=3404118 RepID=UPI003B950F44